ncbi:MAG TPA: MoaD/ThiS family protein [Trebonia sp.]|jgi:molybdopterin synthase sulfur carrier subunit|nr:MoaD/ThiS family protein [Trebonia sp.]
MSAAAATPVTSVRVVLPAHLKNLARVHGEVVVPVARPVLTQRAVLDAVEERFPMLRGTIRDRKTGKRRAFIRFYACEQDLSNDPPDAPLPDAVAAAVAAGTEPFLVVGAMAGG